MSKRRRNRRSLNTRRELKRRNRKDDVPDCTTFEEVDYSGNESRSRNKSRKRHSNQCSDYLSRYETCRQQQLPSYESSYFGTTSVSAERMPGDCRSSTSMISYRSALQSDSAATGRTRRRKKSRRNRKSLGHLLRVVLEALGRAVTEFLIFIISYFKSRDSKLTPAVIGISIVCCYILVLYLELSLASIAQLITSWVWPSSHAALRMFERFFLSVSNFFRRTDDLGESYYCDMATAWCDHFDLMCDQRCSFTKLALERIR